MQDQRNDNVVSLFGTVSPCTSQNTVAKTNPMLEEQSADQVFSDVMRRNAENQRRLRQDRNKANKSVLRSYRIKT